MNRIIENMRIFRQMQGYTQSYIANSLGIALTTYAQIERGEKLLNLNKIPIICEILGIDENTLRTFDKSIYFKSLTIK